MTEPLDEADVARAWNRNAEQWADDVQAGFDLYRDLYTFPHFLAFMPKIAGRKVIDLGCGEGTNTRRFAQLGGHLTGIDISEALIARARAEESKAPLGIRYEVDSFARLEPFGDASFDCALSTMALMDGPDFAAAMRATHRVLRSGGELCFSILHPCFVTPVLRWLREGEDGAYLGLQVGRYFDKVPFVERWRFSKRPAPETVEPFEVPHFPRTLSDYLNAVCDAGFRIARLDEPRPEAIVAREREWLQRWHEHAPFVLFVSARKA
jgi:SAM-dependent methyltransferase